MELDIVVLVLLWSRECPQCTFAFDFKAESHTCVCLSTVRYVPNL